MGTGSGGYGQETPWDDSSDFNVIAFIVKQMIARMETMRPVKVVAVHSNGVAAAPGTVDVLPLVNQVDGNSNPTEHGVVNGIPWFRLQSGSSAVICDPQVDDVGFVIVSNKDISLVKSSNGAQSNPGSFRTFNLADGIYVGGLAFAVAPNCYVLFKSDGHLKIVDASGNVLETSASGFALTGNLAVTGTITATGNITAGLGGADVVTMQAHIHAGNNVPPTPGH